MRSRRSDFRARANRSPRTVLPLWSTADMAPGARLPLLLSPAARVESPPLQIALTRSMASARLPQSRLTARGSGGRHFRVCPIYFGAAVGGRARRAGTRELELGAEDGVGSCE